MITFSKQSNLNKIGLLYGWKITKGYNINSKKFISNTKMYWCLQEFSKYLNFFINMFRLSHPTPNNGTIFIYFKKRSITLAREFYYKEVKKFWKHWHTPYKIPFFYFFSIKKLFLIKFRLHFFFNFKRCLKPVSMFVFSRRVYTSKIFLNNRKNTFFFKSRRFLNNNVRSTLNSFLPRRQSIKTNLYSPVVSFLFKKQQFVSNLVSKTFYLFLQKFSRPILKSIFFINKRSSFCFKNCFRLRFLLLKSKRRKKKKLKKLKLKKFFFYTNKKKYSPLVRQLKIVRVSSGAIYSTCDSEFFDSIKLFELRSYLLPQLIFSSLVFKKPTVTSYRIFTNLFYKFFFLTAMSKKKRYRLLLSLKKMIRSKRLLPPPKKKTPAYKLFLLTFTVPRTQTLFNIKKLFNTNINYSIVYNNFYYNIFFFKHWYKQFKKSFFKKIFHTHLSKNKRFNDVGFSKVFIRSKNKFSKRSEKLIIKKKKKSVRLKPRFKPSYLKKNSFFFLKKYKSVVRRRKKKITKGRIKKTFYKNFFFFFLFLQNLLKNFFDMSSYEIKFVNSSHLLAKHSFFNALNCYYSLQSKWNFKKSKKFIMSLVNFKFYYDPVILMNDIRDEFKKTRRAKRSIGFFKDLISQFHIENVETHQILLKGKTAKLSRAEKNTFSDLYRGVPVLDVTQEIICTAANTWAKLGTYGIYLWFHYKPLLPLDFNEKEKNNKVIST